MKSHYLTRLRDRDTNTTDFRLAIKNLSSLIASDVVSLLPTIPCSVTTPLGKATGEHLVEGVILVPILRAGLILLPPFIELLPQAPIGFFGIRREEKTARPLLYYENIPPLSQKDHILLLDPMLATGGSAVLALRQLQEKNGNLAQALLVTMIASPEGIQAVDKAFPQVKIYAAAIDEKLDANKYIFPGLGDIGDRYFGT